MPVRVTAPRFELTSQRQKVSRYPTMNHLVLLLKVLQLVVRRQDA